MAGLDVADLVDAGSGYDYLFRVVPVGQLRLVRRDFVPVAQW